MSIDTEVELLKNRRTKIVATLGPASASREVIDRLVAAGVNVFRLNFSHGTREEHARVHRRVREAGEQAGRAIGVLADLSGPKIRVGVFPGGPIELREGERVTVTVRDVPGAPGLIPSQYERLAEDVRPGDRILLADGLMELRVLAVHGTEIECEVVSGGVLSDRKGMNLPDTELSAPALTDKDREDAVFATGLGVEYLGLSFVRRAADVADLRTLLEGLGEQGRDTGIIAKIERPEALANARAIIEASDGVMVARGDLGVELPEEEVPVIQRELIDLARRASRPVIVATQMLESMVEHPRPTRAEVADVSFAVSGGTDAVMLSAETASGRYPVQAVETMARIAHYTEGYLWKQGAFGSLMRREDLPQPIPFGDAIARAMALLARDLRVHAVVVVSSSGMSAVTMSSARPAAPVVVLSPRPSTWRRMSLMWGVIPVLAEEAVLADPVGRARQVSRDMGLAAPGEYILLVRGFHADPQLNTPAITLITV